ncbi:TRAP transporter large permease [Arthrobacter sp. UCD-GKA]|uniref:TRAP transporter large permease n=1 Tax=Arthrobacter sp. UCD-GKA TaxID=1913576 RepID=UPI0009F6EE7F|nr:TRAP transporter large permease [Arthrobacter sp. UCD-GKA]
MSADAILIIVGIVFLVLMLIETPIAYTLAGSGALGIVLLKTTGVATGAMATVPFSAVNNYSLSVIPMYVLLGMLALHGHLATRLYALASRMLGWLPGGLGVATVAACAGFAAISGSSIATAATIGKLATAEMHKYGYPKALAGGIVAAAGTLGVLIPPSVILVMYSIMAQESIGQMLVAGIVPGVILAVAFAVYVVVRFRSGALTEQRPLIDELAVLAHSAGSVATLEYPNNVKRINVESGRVPIGSVGGGVNTTPDDRQTASPDTTSWQQVRAVLWIVVIFSVILGGIFTGLFTVIESAAIGAAVAMVMVFLEIGIRRGSGVFEKIQQASLESVAVVGMAFAMLIGATLLTRFLVMAQVPVRLTNWISDLPVSPLLVVALILLSLIPLGMFLESLSIILVVVPLVAPIVVSLGFDPIWFGILFVMMVELGLITPPVGMNVFVTSTTSKIPIETVFRGTIPFFFVALLVVAFFFFVPDVVLWLPELLTE